MNEVYDIAVANRNFTDLNPVSCGHQNCEPAHSFGPHIREYYLLHYVTSGYGTFFRDGVNHRVGPNQIFLICPHELTTYTADKQHPWSYIWAGFTGALAARLDTLPPVIDCKTNLFHEMLDCEDLKSCREEFLASKLFALFTQLFEAGGAPNDYAQQVCDYIDANYMNELSICDIARLVGVERTYLAKLFKEKTQMSMQNYLIHTRLSRAAQLLARGYTVAESAAICGYSDSFNFSKMFKRRYGVSPAAYKKTIKNNPLITGGVF